MDLYDAFGQCVCCGRPCTTGGCINPSCVRCQRKFYPVSKTVHYRYELQADGTYRLVQVDDPQPEEQLTDEPQPLEPQAG